MGLISKIDAAIKMGVGIELIDYFTKNCPKSGDNLKLKAVNTELGKMYDEDDLISYQHYLNQPWPSPKTGSRPTIPESIKKDIKVESHYSCAICGHMDNGEVAHIVPAHKSLNNAPSNLIFLCPNHHTKYDLGYTINSNITSEEVSAAKLLKRKSRCRVLRYEANATRSLYSLIKLLSSIESKLKEEDNDNLSAIYLTETRKLIESIPELTAKSYEQAKKDKLTNKTEDKLSQIAPQLTKFANSGAAAQSESNLRSAVNSIVSCASEIVIDIDEEECPHCLGRGTTGLVGDICNYCGGSCVVTEEEREAYDPDDIDEEECPHCLGRGTTGLVGDICNYCGGSCVVTEEEREAYDPDDIDEEECPHCLGQGTTGLVGDICALCGGSCVVIAAKRDAYAEKYGK